MKNFLKRDSGITLVALVVTIIVLLILAGVSLNLVAGSNGILSRANNAVNSMNLAKIKEELELKIAEMQLDYYSESGLQSTYKTANEYVKEQLKEGIAVSNGIEIKCDDSGKLTYEELEIGMLNPDGTVTIDGEFNGGQIVAKYKVTYNANGGTGSVPTDSKKYESGDTVTVDFSTKPTKKGSNFLGWATSSSAITPEYTDTGSFTIKQNTTLYAVWEKLLGTAAIKPEFYGDTVNYSANSVKDWKVFLNDGSNVYLISSDNVSQNGLYLESNIIKSTDTSTGVYSSDNRKTLVSWLTTNSYWNRYAEGFSGSIATGGPTLEQWIMSWNAKGYTKLYLATESGMADGLIGYYIGDNENPTSSTISISNDLGYNDILYYPRKSSGYTYWLASPSTFNTFTLVQAYNNGGLGGGNHYFTGAGVRPLVKLPASAKMSWNGSNWDLSE